MQKLHEYGGFKFDKQELSKLFYILFNNPAYKYKELEAESGFGKNKIENLRYYLKNIGLLTADYSPSELATSIYENDKYFEDEVTLWILLYHWSKKTANPFLYYLLYESVDPKTKEELKRDFISWALANGIKTDYDKNKDLVGGLIARTLNSFTETAAFKSLNVFSQQLNKYSKDTPYKTHPILVAYVLYDNRDGRTTISFEELLKEEENIGKFFNLTRESLQKTIYALRDIGLLQYVQSANLHNIVYTYQNTPLSLINRYYEQY